MMSSIVFQPKSELEKNKRRGPTMLHRTASSTKKAAAKKVSMISHPTHLVSMSQLNPMQTAFKMMRRPMMEFEPHSLLISEQAEGSLGAVCDWRFSWLPSA